MATFRYLHTYTHTLLDTCTNMCIIQLDHKYGLMYVDIIHAYRYIYTNTHIHTYICIYLLIHINMYMYIYLHNYIIYITFTTISNRFQPCCRGDVSILSIFEIYLKVKMNMYVFISLSNAPVYTLYIYVHIFLDVYLYMKCIVSITNMHLYK